MFQASGDPTPDPTKSPGKDPDGVIEQMDTEEPAGVADTFGGPDAAAAAAPTPRVDRDEELSPEPRVDWAAESEELAEGEDLEDEGESGELAEGEDAGEPAIDEATGLERAKESSSVLQWDAENLNPVLQYTDLKGWYGALFNTFQPRWDGEIISLEVTPTIMSAKLYVVANRNRLFREQSLDDIRYLVEERLYVAAKLVSGNRFHAIREIPASLIGLKDRNGILGHAEERLARDPDDVVAKTMIAALQAWKDDPKPASNLGLYWGKAKRSQNAEGKDDEESVSSHEEGDTHVEDPPVTQEEPHAEAAGEPPKPPAAAPPAGDLLEVRVAALDPQERVVYLEHLIETASDLKGKEERKLANERKSRIKGMNHHKLEAIACGAGEDPVPAPNGPQPTTLLMQEPILHCCRRCGAVGDHTCEQYAKEPVTATLTAASSFDSLFSFAEGSIAAREADPIVPVKCDYTRCYGPKDHAAAACPALHRRCPRCRCRGHTDTPIRAEGGGTIVACPLARGEGQTGPSYETLHREFEDFADKGHLTKWRKLGYPGAGFFPAFSLKGIRYLKAIGYKPLMRASTEQGILRCNEFYRDTSTMTGLGIQFESLEDAELAEIERIRGKVPKPPSAKRQRFEQPAAPATNAQDSETSTYSGAASAAPKPTATTGPGPVPKPIVKTKAERRETPPATFRKPSDVTPPAPQKRSEQVRELLQKKYPPGHPKHPLYPTQGLKPSVRDAYARGHAKWERDHQRAAQSAPESEESSSSSPRKGRKPSPHPRDRYARNSGRSSDGDRTSDRSRSGHRGGSRSGSDSDRRRGGQDHQSRQEQISAQRRYYALHNVPKALRTFPAASGSHGSSKGSKAGASSDSSSTSRPSHQEVAGPKKGLTKQTQAQLVSALSGLGNVGDKIATGKQAETILRQFGAIE